MRRVVVTGLGMVTPLASGVEPTWARLLAGRVRHPPDRDLRRLGPAGQDRRHGAARRGRRACSRPTDYVEAKELRRNDDFIVYGIAAAVQAVEDSGWKPEDEESALPDRRAARLRHRRPQHHRRDHADPGEGRPAPGQPVLHPGGPDQPRQRPGLDPLRLQGPEPRRGHRLLDRRPRHRRRRPADRAGRCRRHGGRRLRGGAGPDRHGRLRRRARALDRLQRDAGEGLAPLGQGPRRLRHGRGCGLRRARGVRARQAPRGQDLRRGQGLRPVRRRLPRHRAQPRGRWRLPLDAGGAQARRPAPGRHRLRQRPRHQHAARRRDRAGCGQAPVRQRGGQALDVLDQVGDRPSPGCRRCGRGDLLHPRDPRPGRPADPEPRQPVRRLRRRRPRAAQGQGARGAGRRCPTRSASAAPTPA